MIKHFNTSRKSAIKHIMMQAGWVEMMEVVTEAISGFNSEPVKAETEFETVWRTAQREAKGQALRDFFNSLEEEVLK
jgi:hypothetical protein